MGFSFWKNSSFQSCVFYSLDIFFIILYPKNSLFYEIHFMTFAIKWIVQNFHSFYNGTKKGVPHETD